MSVDYEWRLRVVMAEHGMFKANEMTPRLAEHGIRLSDSQVWRMVTGCPERLNLRVLVVLCEVFDCEVSDLVRSVQSAKPAAKEPASSGTIKQGLRPKQARLRHPGA